MKVGVFVSDLARFDAMGNDAVEMYRLLVAAGVEVEFFVTHLRDRCEGVEVTFLRDSEAFLDDPENVLIFHYGIFEPMFDRVKASRCRKILRYHNITESKYFVGYDDYAVEICDKGRAQLRSGLRAFDSYWSNSEFTASELVDQFGGDREKSLVLNPFHNIEKRFEQRGFSEQRSQFSIIAVGKLSPHKNQLALLRGYKSFLNRLSGREREEVVLRIVGKVGQPLYADELYTEAARMNLCDRVEFHVEGVDDAALAQLYKKSDLFVGVSRHEGFCVPVVEAMYGGLPIVSSRCGALEKTVSFRGLRLPENTEDALASALFEVYASIDLRQSLSALSASGFEYYSTQNTKQSFLALFQRAVGAG